MFWFDHGLQANVGRRDHGLSQEQLLRSHEGSRLSLRCLLCRRRSRGVSRLDADRTKSQRSFQRRWKADTARVARGGALALELDVATLGGGMLGTVSAGPDTTGAELRARVATLARVPAR